MHDHSLQYPLPCLYCHPYSYIRMVQNLIERCILFHMSQDQCVRALAEHAGIKPLVTVTVWKELQKENKEFFRAYLQVTTPRPLFMSRCFQRRPNLARRKHWK
ncbi:hypothetical protein AAZX31_18G129600 [Glycine max]|uniref:Angiotensin-converting enzyme 2 n=2 Tax=Glycine subgen. Soja TaxID=1462606 RepID=I1N1I4_SOYBN|nr:uncharacterized protein LOC100784875 isoform X1 [Glycine max]XP_028213518.1 uncharacterized protein LOC114395851 isoform X1 [Glycine soja]KAG4921352.1 hypothetical protein JHK86_050165 [Glycine max]KAG5091544.1 hypothetical protein JHK82_050322 [Glycine max]KAG5094637.1 hypothetical protein JHK84_050225 [Glycine max]KAH1154466.1 hypothetical protein GYH30_049947 [Glycine max]KHN23198.1 hypothetical protein glysoja_043643 [Glycine soja]|eukprot:XP_003552028.1 uncharacterized protein LOC100784875 isoform X1 [Glycine max]